MLFELEELAVLVHRWRRVPQVLGQAFSASALFMLGLQMVGKVKSMRGAAMLVPLMLISIKWLVPRRARSSRTHTTLCWSRVEYSRLLCIFITRLKQTTSCGSAALGPSYFHATDVQGAANSISKELSDSHESFSTANFWWWCHVTVAVTAR